MKLIMLQQNMIMGATVRVLVEVITQSTTATITPPRARTPLKK